jgi:ubiquinol-cytochrome c reductase iron-sulfur subunit
MSDQHEPQQGQELAVTAGDEGHDGLDGQGGQLPARFENPGLPAHHHRMGDTDPVAAKRAERQVATLFLISMVGTVGFIVTYFAVGTKEHLTIPGQGSIGAQNLLFGLTLGISLFCIGAGAIHWAKTLMPDEEVVEYRHLMRSSDEDREAAVATLQEGGAGAGIGRRPMIKYTLGGALGLFALPLGLQLVGGLGPLPHNELSTTMWRKGLRLVRDPELTPIKATDVTIGSVFHVMPEGIDKVSDELEQKAKAAVLLMRLNPEDIKVAKERAAGYEGIVAYSKICTHVGCPVGLYEQQTHHLLCPCHQSTFDVTEDCKVIFGPAHRPLPQLAITVDTEGYLVAQRGFDQAVGPSFWERG